MKIGDFGMSRFVGADEIMTALGPQHLSRNLTVDVIGTAHYASPELLNDEVPYPTAHLAFHWTFRFVKGKPSMFASLQQ